MAVTIGSIAEGIQGVTYILSAQGYWKYKLPCASRQRLFEEMTGTVKIGAGPDDSKTQVGSARERH
jgi:hypothetical protein